MDNGITGKVSTSSFLIATETIAKFKGGSGGHHHILEAFGCLVNIGLQHGHHLWVWRKGFCGDGYRLPVKVHYITVNDGKNSLSHKLSPFVGRNNGCILDIQGFLKLSVGMSINNQVDSVHSLCNHKGGVLVF